MNNTALLGLLAETSIHAGAGQSGGVIDLPIQREAHTGWPVVYGSAVKGALRALAEENKEKNAAWLTAVFGPETTNASDHAGALLVGDARLLLLPVRSLTSHFKWVTCPALLKRFAADAARLGLPCFATAVIPNVADQHTVLLPDPGKAEALYLEEFRLHIETGDFNDIIPVLASLMDRPEAAQSLRAQLALVHDDRFSHLAQFATPVNAHVCIDNRTKTVRDGMLWYEETLPPDTLLYVALYAQAARRPGADMSAAEVLARVTGELFERPYLQLGGNETVGMGWCKISVQRIRGD